MLDGGYEPASPSSRPHIAGARGPPRIDHATLPLPLPDVRRRRAPRHGPILAPVQQPYGGPSNPSEYVATSERRQPPVHHSRPRRRDPGARFGPSGRAATRPRRCPCPRCASAPSLQSDARQLWLPRRNHWSTYCTLTPPAVASRPHFRSRAPSFPFCTAHSPIRTHDDTHTHTGTRTRE